MDLFYFSDFFYSLSLLHWRVDVFSNYISFWFCSNIGLVSLIYVIKLTVIWFFVVWLRLNMLRLRFDQVASFTWHELVIYVIFLLIHAILLNILF